MIKSVKGGEGEGSGGSHHHGSSRGVAGTSLHVDEPLTAVSPLFGGVGGLHALRRGKILLSDLSTFVTVTFECTIGVKGSAELSVDSISLGSAHSESSDALDKFDVLFRVTGRSLGESTDS